MVLRWSACPVTRLQRHLRRAPRGAAACCTGGAVLRSRFAGMGTGFGAVLWRRPVVRQHRGPATPSCATGSIPDSGQSPVLPAEADGQLGCLFPRRSFSAVAGLLQRAGWFSVAASRRTVTPVLRAHQRPGMADQRARGAALAISTGGAENTKPPDAAGSPAGGAARLAGVPRRALGTGRRLAITGATWWRSTGAGVQRHYASPACVGAQRLHVHHRPYFQAVYNLMGVWRLARRFWQTSPDNAVCCCCSDLTGKPALACVLIARQRAGT